MPYLPYTEHVTPIVVAPYPQMELFQVPVDVVGNRRGKKHPRIVRYQAICPLRPWPARPAAVRRSAQGQARDSSPTFCEGVSPKKSLVKIGDLSHEEICL